MVKQIKTDENNVVICCSLGGFVEGGFDVEDIPDEVMACPSRWLFIPAEVEKNEESGEIEGEEIGEFAVVSPVKGTYEVNPNYSEAAVEEGFTLDDLVLAVAELAEESAADKLEIEMAIAELAEVILNG
ncbi:MAG: hypothetical protein ACI4YB_06275 [Oscillospiraceae bacterium]